jgi:Ca2+-binding RTX toxin-like protein
MATIYGRVLHYPSTNHYRHLDDTLYGTAFNDYIDGRGGNDTIFAGSGNDTVYGGYGNDTIHPGDSAGAYAALWGNDWVSGGYGDDVIDYARNQSGSTLYGDDGLDFIFGGSSGDYISGGTGTDFLLGNAGSDTIRGDQGVDQIWGDSGNDYIVGGWDRDWLAGGSGSDTFAYETVWDSGLSRATADTIRDFNPWYDRLDFARAGNLYNFVSTSLYGSDFDSARNWAAGKIGAGATYAFATGNSPDDGSFVAYLFADADGNGTMDTGIELAGVSPYMGFGYWNIV